MIKYKVNKKMRPRQGVCQIYQNLGMDFNVVKDVRQIYANDVTIAMLENNILRWVNRKYSFLPDRKKKSMVAMDMLGWAPVTNNDIPDGEIWVYETLPL